MTNHAAYAIFGDFTIVYAKTTKTACGKRVATAKLKSRITLGLNESDCTACVAQIQADRDQARDRGSRVQRWYC